MRSLAFCGREDIKSHFDMRGQFKKVVLLLLALQFGSMDFGSAQSLVRLGDCEFEPEPNVVVSAARSVRSVPQDKVFRLGEVTGGRRNVLLQFKRGASEVGKKSLERLGVTLTDYLGGDAYWALLPAEIDAHRALARSGVRSVMGTRPEWKASGALLAGVVPAWAQRESGVFAFTLVYASNASENQVRADLERLGALDVEVHPGFRFATGRLPIVDARRVAALDYVLVLEPVAPEYELENYEGARLSGAATLSRSAEMGGRALTGAGIRAGIWDGNVEYHPDFGDRVTRVEFERGSDDALHGTHVAGTMFGSGLQDARGRGMAPGLRVWAYNFGKQKNGLSEVEEMVEARAHYGVTLTQHSYGFSLQKSNYKRYSYLSSYGMVDRFSYDHPTVVNVYSAGNDQGRGGEVTAEVYGDGRYGTSTKRAKNVLHIGALESDGSMTTFSSWGPMDDGRMLPTVCTKGEDVYSTKPGGGYQLLSGTSMACPTASGHVALIQERYRQLNGGADIRNDLLRAVLVTGATDAGNKGPDYSYGFGILNAVKSVEILEAGTFVEKEMGQGAVDPQTFSVTVPKGARSLRVSLAWIDPVSNKVYSYGENPMVNDLDLSVSVNGKVYLPLVCDPKNPAKPAEQKEDHLNNIEQVVIEELRNQVGSTVEVKVTPRLVAQGPQRYCVAYQFDQGELRVLSPRAGEVLVPGEPFYLRVAGIEGPYKVEFSTDNGANYRHLGELERFEALDPYCKNIKVKLPIDVSPTKQARFRVLTDDGRSVESDRDIVVARRAMGLALDGVACGNEDFVLRWKEVEKAEDGYVVLRSAAGAGGYEKLAEVQQGVTEYVLKREELVEGACYTVACRMGDGWGPLALAVVPSVMRPIAIKDSELPWKEDFVVTPSPYFSVKTQKGNTIKFLATTHPEMPLGSHKHLAIIGKQLASFSVDNPFASGHAANTINYEFCGLDLRDVPASKELMFHLRVGMEWAPVNADRGPWFRLLLDGRPIKDAAGVEVHERLPEFVDLYYPVIGGKEHTLSMQFVGKYNLDRFAIYQLAVEENSAKNDVSLALVKIPASSVNLTSSERVRVMLYNAGGLKQERVGIRLLRNNLLAFQQVVEDLLPYERRELSLPVDLAMQQVLGETFKITVCADLPGDEQPTNNSVSGEVTNMGRVFTMPRGDILASPMGPVPIDPKRVYQLKDGERLIFTDDGGALTNFHAPQVSTLKVLPSKEGRVVRVRFKEFSCNDDGAHLLVFNETVPDNLNVQNLFFDKELLSTSVMPYSTVSRAADGALTFFIEAMLPGAGWIAEIDEVPTQNSLTITNVTTVHQGPEAEGEVPVRVTLKNRYGVKIDNITLKYNFLEDDHEEVLEGLSLFPMEERVFEFPKKLTLKSGVVSEVKIWAECEDDTDGRDNDVTVSALYDPYPIPGILVEPASPTIGKVGYMGGGFAIAGESKLPNGLKRFPRYQLRDTLILYKGEPREPIGLVNLRADAGDAVRLWVDWNENKVFAQDELVAELVVDSDTKLDEAQLKELGGLLGASIGSKRARLAVGNREELGGPALEKGLTRGVICDFIVRVVEGSYPANGDLSLKSVLLQKADGSPLTTGKNLPADCKLAVVVENNGNTAFSGKFTVKVDVNGVESTEEVDLAAAGLGEIPPYGKSSLTIPLTYAFDASAVGKHLVKVTLEELPLVVNAKNNVAKDSVYCIVPQTKDYAISFKSRSKDFREYVQLPKGYKGSKKQATIEFWAYMHEAKYEVFMEGEEYVFCAFNNMKANYPDKSLGIVLRDGVYYTGANTLLPKRWNHVAIVMDEIERGSVVVAGKCKLKVYINGQAQDVTVDQPDATSKLDKPMLGTYLTGMIDEVRVWEDVRSQEEIEANMYRHLPSDGREDLVYEFTFSEGPGNKYTYGTDAKGEEVDGVLMEADASRLSAADELWFELATQEQLSEARFGGQAKQEVQPDGTRVIFFRKGVDRTGVSADFVTVWPNTTILYEGTPVGSETKFDLTDGKTVALTFESQVFGETYTQTVRFQGKEDESHECELLSLSIPKGENPGLTDDLAPVAITPDMEIATVAAPINPESVKINFTVSPGARVIYNGQKLTSGGAVDLRNPAVLTVTAANGRDSKHYSVRLAVKNVLTSTLADATYTYGDPSVDITVNSSAAEVPLTYASTNARVASISGGKLRIGVPGEAIVSISQDAKGIYAASNVVSAKIIVNKRRIDVTPAIADVSYMEPLKWTFRFSSTVPQGDEFELATVRDLAGYVLCDASGTEVSEGAALLPGKYSVKSKVAGTVETAKYIVTPKIQSDLNVKVSAELAALAFTVTDVEGRALAGAGVDVAGSHLLSDNVGMCRVAVSSGMYTYTVSKVGYQMRTGTIEVGSGLSQENVQLKPAKYTLKYAVGSEGGGFIYGVDKQNVADGGSGQLVEAIPNEGFRFVRWSDGEADARRMDRLVKADLTVYAVFEKRVLLPVYRVTFHIEGDGQFADGSTVDEVFELQEGDALPAMAVMPKGEKTYFVSWNDGFMGKVRPEKQKVHADVTLTAIFAKSTLLPFREDFEEGKFSDSWRIESTYPDRECHWKVFKGTIPLLSNVIPTQAAAIITAENMENDPELYKSSLQLPVFDIENIGADLRILFDWSYLPYNSELSLSYSLDGGEPQKIWTKVGEAQEVLSSDTLSISANELKGKKTIALAFTYKSTQSSFYAAIDNIRVYADDKKELTVKLISAPAGMATFTSSGNEITELKVQRGDTIPEVQVATNASYVFNGWYYDGKMVDVKAFGGILEDITLTASLSKKDVVLIGYAVEPSNSGTVQKDGKSVTQQVLDRGSDALEVVATANSGFLFSHWADNGSATKERTDRGVNESMRLTAVFLQRTVPVTFKVSEGVGGVHIRDARIVVTNADGESTVYVTGVGGEVTMHLPYGHYRYKVDSEGYASVDDGTLEVSGTAISEEVALTKQVSTGPILVVVVDAETGNPLTSASVRVGSISKNADPKGVAHFDFPVGYYVCSVECVGYKSLDEIPLTVPNAEGRVTVVLHRDVAVHEVKFVVKDTDTDIPIVGASVRIGALRVVTGTEGVAVVSLSAGAHDYVAACEGYHDVESAVTVTGTQELVTVRLERLKYRILLKVQDAQGNALEGALISLNGQKKRTEKEGTVEFTSLLSGSYEYSVSCERYLPITSKRLFIVSSDREVTEVMSLAKREITVLVRNAGEVVSGAKILFTNDAGVAVGPFITGDEGTVSCSLYMQGYKYTAEWKGLVKSGACDVFQLKGENLFIELLESSVLSYGNADHGSIEVRRDGTLLKTGSTIYKGQELEIDAKEEAHYMLASLTVNGVDVEGPYRHTVNGDVQVSATFKPIMRKVVCSVVKGNGVVVVTAGGEVVPNNAQVAENTQVTIEIKGGAVEYIKVNGQLIHNGDSYTVLSDTRIEVSFADEKGTAVENAVLALVDVSPNPFKNVIKLRHAEGVERFRVVNLQGVELLRGDLHGEDCVDIPATTFVEGEYVLVLYRGKELRRIMVVKQQ